MADPGWQRLAEQARALLEEGATLDRAGDVDQAVEVLLRAQGLLSEHGHTPLASDLYYRTGILRTRLGQTEEAETLFERALESASWCDYPRGQAYAINGLAVIAQRRGEIDVAETRFRRAGRMATEVSEHRLSGMVEQNLGVLANIRGDLDSAMVHYQCSLEAFELAGDVEGMCWVLNNLGMLQVDLKRFKEGEKTLLRGQKLAKKNKNQVTATQLELNRVEALVGLGRWRAARKACQNVLKAAREREDNTQRSEALKYRAIIEREQGKLEASVDSLDEAGRLAEKTGDKLLRAEILRELGETLGRGGQIAQARLHLEYALRVFTELDAVLDVVDTRRKLESLAEADSAGSAG